jgi:hypothetical protein
MVTEELSPISSKPGKTGVSTSNGSIIKKKKKNDKVKNR